MIVSSGKYSRIAGLPAAELVGLRVRFELRHVLLLIVLASLLCMAVRSFLLLDFTGMLIWPALLGFGVERLLGGHGVLAGTIGGAVSFAGAAAVFFSGHRSIATALFDPGFIPVTLMLLAAGICWGFYLSIWVYIIVETILQYL